MLDITQLKQDILHRLEPLNLEKIILFGSYAYGTPTEESDLDLYVVTNDDFVPQTWREKMNVVRNVSKHLRDIREHVAIDLVVHTKAMNHRFRELNSSFSREIYQKGEVLL